MVTIVSKPDELSLSGNLKSFKISTSTPINFTLSVDSEMLVNETYHPSNNIAEIDIKDVVINALNFILQYSTSYVQPTIIRTFIANIDGQEFSFKAIRTGVSNLADSPLNWLKGNFLTWQPKLKKITYYTPEWLTYYAVIACDIKIKAYFNDKTNKTITLQNCVAGLAYTFNMQYAVVSGLFSGERPMYYEIAAYNGAEQISYTQRYIVSEQYSNDEQWILFENSLGGIDTFRAIGVTDFNGEHTHNCSVIDDIMEEFQVDTERLYTKNTGHLNKYERRWLLDFFPSRSKFIYQDSAIHKISLKESEVAYRSSDLPSSYTFTYRFADINPYLNLIRDEGTLPSNISISVPDSANFTIPPRLAEFPRVPLHEGVIIPAFDPNGDKPTVASFDAIKNKIKEETLNSIPGANGTPGSGGSLVNLIQENDPILPSDFNAFTSLRTLKEIQKRIDGNSNETEKNYLRKDTQDTASEQIDFQKGIKIGAAELSWDPDANALRISESVFSQKEVSAYGKGVGSGSGAATTLWELSDVADSVFDAPEGSVLQKIKGEWVARLYDYFRRGLTDSNEKIIESPEEYKLRVPKALRYVGLSVTLRTNSTDTTYTKYEFKEGIEDYDLVPVNYFIGIEDYIEDSFTSSSINKALSANKGKELYGLVMNINCGTY